MDSAQKIANCIQAAARDVGIKEPTEQQAKNIIGLGLSEAMQLLFPHQSPATISRLVEAYRYNWLQADKTAQQLFPQVRSGLAKLAESGAFLAVATGKSRVGLQRQLDELDLGQYFVASRCADETRSKPHPQMLLELLDYTAVNPHNTLMIGDTSYDMEMAHGAEVAALGVSYGVHSEAVLRKSGAAQTLNSFAEVIEWLLPNRVRAPF